MSRAPQGTHRQFRALPEIRPGLAAALTEPAPQRAKTVVHGPKVRADGRHPAIRFGDDVVLEVRRLALRSPPADVQAQLQAAGHDVPMHSIQSWITYTNRAHLVPDRARTTTYLKDCHE